MYTVSASVKDLIVGLAWPFTVLIIVLIFNRGINRLLNNSSLD
jgi:hypothetical protein